MADLGDVPATDDPSPALGAGVVPLREPVEPDIDLNRLNVFVTVPIEAGLRCPRRSRSPRR
jgi:hypothetical protein